VETLQKVIGMFPKSCDMLILKGEAQYRLGLHQEALLSFQRAEFIDPGKSEKLRLKIKEMTDLCK